MSEDDKISTLNSDQRNHAPSIVHQLLAVAAARGRPEPAGLRGFTAWDGGDTNQMLHVIEAGLGPMLHRVAASANMPIPLTWHDTLHSASLTAQVRHGNLVDTACEVIDLCATLGVPVTLLKGISTSDEFYPVPLERPMGDIDVLVPTGEQQRVESALLRLGFRPTVFEMEEGSDHGPPLRHQERQTVVEVHTALFPRDDPLQRNKLFSAADLAARSVQSTFCGRSVRRFTHELQLTYIAAYWIRDLTHHHMHPSFIPPLFDAVYLLATSGQSLDWDALFAALDNESASTSLYVLLSFVARQGLSVAAVPFLPRLASAEHRLGRLDLRIVHALLERYLLQGRPLDRAYGNWRQTVVLRALTTMLSPGSSFAKVLRVPWNVAFPSVEPDRYRLRFHRARIARMLRRDRAFVPRHPTKSSGTKG